MITIRFATFEDVEWLFTQCIDFDRFFGAKQSLMADDPAYTRELLATLITQHIVLVAVRGVELIGFIAGSLASHPFRPTLSVATELLWWVLPPNRQSSAGARLLNAFEDVARDRGAQWILMALEAESPVRPESLTRRGYRAKETSYLLEVA